MDKHVLYIWFSTLLTIDRQVMSAPAPSPGGLLTADAIGGGETAVHVHAFSRRVVFVFHSPWLQNQKPLSWL